MLRHCPLAGLALGMLAPALLIGQIPARQDTFNTNTNQDPCNQSLDRATERVRQHENQVIAQYQRDYVTCQNGQNVSDCLRRADEKEAAGFREVAKERIEANLQWKICTYRANLASRPSPEPCQRAYDAAIEKLTEHEAQIIAQHDRDHVDCQSNSETASDCLRRADEREAAGFREVAKERIDANERLALCQRSRPTISPSVNPSPDGGPPPRVPPRTPPPNGGSPSQPSRRQPPNLPNQSNQPNQPPSSQDRHLANTYDAKSQQEALQHEQARHEEAMSKIDEFEQIAKNRYEQKMEDCKQLSAAGEQTSLDSINDAVAELAQTYLDLLARLQGPVPSVAPDPIPPTNAAACRERAIRRRDQALAAAQRWRVEENQIHNHNVSQINSVWSGRARWSQAAAANARARARATPPEAPPRKQR